MRETFFVDFHIDYHLNRPEEVFIAYMELRNLSDDNFRKIEKLRGKYELILSKILTDGVKEDLFFCKDIKGNELNNKSFQSFCSYYVIKNSYF